MPPMTRSSTDTVEIFEHDGLLFAFRALELWVWREGRWEHQEEGSYLRVHLHQAAYRPDGRAKRLQTLPDGVPAPPTSIPPTPPSCSASSELLDAMGEERSVYLVLHEDPYESMMGDGTSCVLRGAFFDRDEADALAERTPARVHRRTLVLASRGPRIEIVSSDRGAFDTWTLDGVLEALAQNGDSESA